MYKTHPVALFAYNRPDHIRRTLEGLRQNCVPIIYAFCDGSKHQSENKSVNEVRNIIRSIDWTQVIITERDSNWGLARSIVSGINKILEKHETVIVIEDDIVVSRGFYKYMCDGLNTYQNDKKVMHISGFLYPIEAQLPDTFFYNVNSCWGWGTWRRAWINYNDDIQYLFAQIKNLDKKELFYYNGGQNNAFYKQLQANATGALDTWAVKWHTSIYLNNGLCLHPKTSLVENIGFDGSGTNCGNKNQMSTDQNATISVKRIPLVTNYKVYKYMSKYFKKNERKGIIKKTIYKSLQKIRNIKK